MAGHLVRHAVIALLWVVIAVSTVTAEPAAPAVRALRHEIDTYLKSAALSQSHIGIKITSLKTGEIIYAAFDKHLFHPASTLKLFTTSAALSKLGGGFRFKTVLYADSPDIRDGTLQGNLYLKGFADPRLTTESLSWMAVQLRARGLRRITGDLVCDETYLDNWYYGKGWMWDDASSSHFAPIGGLTANNNCVTVRVSPGSGAGEPLAVTIEPQTSYVTINNTAVTDEAHQLHVERRWRERENVINVTGGMAVGQPEQTFVIEITEPAHYTCRLFSEILAANNIGIAEGLHYAAVAEERTELLRYTSAPLSEIIKETNKKSINLYAELLMKTLGAELQSPPGAATKGIGEIKEFLSGIGIDSAALEIADGSGVSDYNLISPGHLVALLMAIYRAPDLRETFIDSLSVAGVDGTLKNRMRHTAAEGRLKAKSGSHTGVRTIAGYTTTPDGEAVAFAIMIENFVVDPVAINDIEDRILVLVSSFSRGR
ncbi:D-alanyl-D-alanine carboxypeptidase/D-alanyl-D-alanine endopeptidase [Candidatus Magnetominusculus dajiuhuensis]|uniref:D-alanyl-D-alanine carboxypeptidase/D-alanyl-D-alanine endopeptidase n=1 Tax=Candidatus Magnetominusculus dajiuhuensis TaxID=3137712 RepID=UPI003B437201